MTEQKGVYKSNAELLILKESMFNEMGNVVKGLFESNEEMRAFDPNDYDLLNAIEENLVIINDKLKQMKIIQEEVKKICPHHPIVEVDVMEMFRKEKEKEIMGNNNGIQHNGKDDEKKFKSDEDIITELEI